MNPSLYPGQDHEVTDLAKRIDTNVDAKVSADELKNFLEAKDITPDKNKLLQVLSSKESELRKISGLESSVRSLVDSLVSRDILKKPFDKVDLTESQKAAILLNEGLYGGKSLSGEQSGSVGKNQSVEDKIMEDLINSGKQVSSEAIKTDNKDQKVYTNKKLELTKDLWDKYTLKRAISNVSGLPISYTANLDEIKLSDDKKSATLTLYMAEKGVLINKEVKDNAHNNDSQTTIKFERQADGSRGLSHNKEDKDTTLIRLQDGSQIVRLPQSDGSAQDFKVSLGNTLQLTRYLPGGEAKNKLDSKLSNTGLSELKPMIDKNEKGAYYYANVLTKDGGLFRGDGNKQIVLFDMNGLPLPDQIIADFGDIDGKKDKNPGYFKTETTEHTQYATGSTKEEYKNYVDKNNISIIKNNYDKTIYDKLDDKEKMSLIVDKNAPELKDYIVDYVAQEGKIHISTRDNGILQSKLTLLKSELADEKQLPIYLNTSSNKGGYYLLKLKDNVVYIQQDIERTEKVNKLKAGYDVFLERNTGNANYGSLDEKISIGSPYEVSNGEDKSFDQKEKKKDDKDIVFAAQVGLDKASSQKDGAKRAGEIIQDKKILIGEIKLQGNTLQGFQEPKKWENDVFYPAKEGNNDKSIVVETPTGLLEYKVGMKMKNGRKAIHFEPYYGYEKEDESKLSPEEKQKKNQERIDTVTKKLISEYKDENGKLLFAPEKISSLKNTEGKFVGYLVNTTQQGSSETYTAFDMKGNIISQLPSDVKTDDNKNLAKVRLDSFYEVKNKNERVIGLTQVGDKIKELSEKIGSAPEKVKKAIENGGFQQKLFKERKNAQGEVIGFIADVSKIDTIKTPATKKSKEKTASVENTYKVYFDLNGNIDNTKSVYKLNTDGSPQITEQMKAEVIGEKLYITKPESLQKAKEDQQASDKRKELLQGYPKEGKVRIEKDNKIYEISASDTKEFAYTKLNDPLAQQQGQYDKDIKYIKDTYVYKDQNLSSYEKTPFYTQLKNLRDADPASFNEHTINELINQEKSVKEKELKPLTIEQQSQLQSKVDKFIKDSNNFKDFDIKRATEVKSDVTVSAVEKNGEKDAKSVQLDKQPTIDTTGKIINTPKIKKTSDVEDKDGKREKGKEEGSFTNKITLLDVNGKSTTATITVDKNKVPTVDNKDYNVIKEINEQGQEVLKLQKKANPTDTPSKNLNTPPTSPDNKGKATESKEIKDRIFNWYGWKSQPTSLNFKYGANDTESFSTQFNIKQANIDNRKSEFKNLLSELMASNLPNKPSIAPTDDEKTAIGKLQDWLIKKEACDCVFGTSDPKKAGLDDDLLGLNTYVALKYTVQKLLHPTELTKEWLTGAFTMKDVPTVPEKKVTVPEKKVTVPEKKVTVPEKKVTVPEKKVTVPEKYNIQKNYPTLKKIIKSNLDKNGNGSATLLFKNGEKHEGEFKNGLRQGKGVSTRADGSRYEGEFKNGLREGKGVYTRPDGSRYEGEYKNALREGKGVYTTPKGNKYVGEFKNDKFEGKGVYTRPDGSKYVGEFKNNVKYRKGVYTRPDGNKYEGEFKNDKFEGKGVYTTSKGKKYSGTFKDDILIKDSTGKSGKWTLEQLDKY